jgi:hypothetical protein
LTRTVRGQRSTRLKQRAFVLRNPDAEMDTVRFPPISVRRLLYAMPRRRRA